MFDKITPPADGSHAPQGSSPARPTTLPADCDPNRFLNWRFKYAMHLVDRADGSPIVHEDTWIQAMIDYRIVSQSHHRQPTETDLAIYTATQLFVSDSLAKHVLEARLLAQQTPEEMSSRCALSPLTIIAYSMLYFDVCGTERKGIWMMRPFASAAVADTEVARLGRRLKQLACSSSSEEIERFISTLQRVDGKTLADGCTDHRDLNCVQELLPRLGVARMLLPMSPAAAKDLRRFQEAAASDVQTGQNSQVAFDLAISVLRRAKVAARLQRELRSMRAELAAIKEPADALKA